MAEKIAPLRLAVSDDAPRRVNLLIPSIDLQHFFGGYIGKFNLARRLAARGERVRIVTVDPVGALPESWRRDVEAYSGLAGMLDEVEVVFGRESQGIEMSRGDALIATTWWTAHLADAALRSLDADRFLYLIQEYEPFTFPMGTYAALAAESYTLPAHRACSRPSCCATTSAATRSASTRRRRRRRRARPRSTTRSPPIDPPAAAELAGRSPRRLLFYARPEPHAARNMFELGVLALSRALERGAFEGLGAARHRLGARGPPARPRRRRADGSAPARGAGGLRRLPARARRRASR